MEEKEFLDFVSNETIENRVSHAYLIETNDIDDPSSLINSFIKLLFHNGDSSHDSKVDLLIDNNDLPDLKVISPVKSGSSVNSSVIIDVDVIRDLISSFSNTSFSEKYEVYVIKDAEKLNLPASNTLLKFLEEPSSNVVAILVCKNRYNLLDTIVSRCQVFSLKNSMPFSISDDDFNVLKNIFGKDKGFLVYNDILKSLPDKASFNNLLINSERYFFDVIRGKIDVDEDLSYSRDGLYKIIVLIEKYIKNNSYNVGYKLTFDNFLTELEEVI